MPRRFARVLPWARADLRDRWGLLIALGVLGGVTGGVALALAAGALRTDSALDRLRERQDAADVVAFPTQVGAFTTDWDALGAAPEVESVAPWALVFGKVEGDLADLVPTFASVDGRFLRDVNRPVVVEGRMFDPEAPLEVVIDETITEVDVGDHIPFRPYSADQDPGAVEATGPASELEVVGRVKTLTQFLWAPGQLMMSPAYLDTYGDEVLAGENADVRLVGGATDVAAFERRLNREVAPGTPILDLHEAARRVETSLAVERAALLGLAAAVAVVGLVLVGQALARSAARVADDATSLRSVGMTRADLTLGATLPHVVAAVVAAAASVATAVVASIWLPVGLAADIDPDRGVQPVWAIVVPGALFVAGLVLGAAALVAWLAVRPRAAKATIRTRGMVAWVRARAPLPVGLGTTIALVPGVGRTRAPVRPALVGAIVGVLGVTAALTIDHGLHEALARPELAGVVWDAEVLALPDQRTDDGLLPDLLTDINAVDGVATTTVVDRALIDVEGIGVQTYALRPAGGASTPAVELTTTSGRAPAAPDEVALGPRTADRLGLEVGDQVALGPDAASFTVVGEALYPSDVHASFDDGLWLTPAGLRSTLPQRADVDALARSAAVEVEDGADVDAVLAGLSDAVGDRAETVDAAAVPAELDNLRNITTLPVVLAVFLAAVAVAALTHVLSTTARRRDQEFAVLRALGVTHRFSRWVLGTQGTVVAVVGLLVGLPLGIAAGRVTWRLIAERVPLQEIPPFAALAVIVVVPVAVLVANLAALWPGRRLARQLPATALHAE